MIIPIYYITEHITNLIALMIINRYFFVDNIDVAKTYGDFIIKAKINMDNPIILDFDGLSTYYFYDKWYLPSDLANKIKGNCS